MRIAYTPEQEELHRELREYFAKLMTPERREALTVGEGDYGDGKAYRETVRLMGRDGWLGIGWPREYGGQSRSMIEQLIFLDEAAIAGAPIPTLTLNSVGPTIMEYGTEEQKQQFLAPILAGEVHFAIGYSEPEAGTDLASLRTRAVRRVARPTGVRLRDGWERTPEEDGNVMILRTASTPELSADDPIVIDWRRGDVW